MKKRALLAMVAALCLAFQACESAAPSSTPPPSGGSGGNGGSGNGGNGGNGGSGNGGNGGSGATFSPDTTDPLYSYYQSAVGTKDGELKDALHQIIKDANSYPNYGELWDCYDESDLQPGTNFIWDMYSDDGTGTSATNRFTYSNDQCGNYSSEGDCYNREHSWPKSWFGGKVEPMNSDMVHVVPTDGKVNGMRGNYPFGEVSSADWTSKNGSKKGNARSGLGYTGTVFEPIDAFKGDFARIYFYMAIRYLNQTVPSSANAGNPMADHYILTPWAETMLRQWHEDDPVSDKERNRNNAIETAQGNRNPFVDYPELVDLIDDL